MLSAALNRTQQELCDTQNQVEEWKQKYQHYTAKVERYKDLLDQRDGTIERLSEELRHLKDDLSNLIRISNEKSSSLKENIKREQFLVGLLKKQRDDIRKLALEKEQQENQIQKLRNENCHLNRQVTCLESRPWLNRGHHALLAIETEIKQLENELRVISDELATFHLPVNDFADGIVAFPTSQEQSAANSRCQDETEHPLITHLTPQERELTSVDFGGTLPSLPQLHEFGCKYSCVNLSLSYHCRRNGIRLCPLSLVREATRRVSMNSGVHCTSGQDCERALQLFISAKFLKRMKSATEISSMSDLDQALRDVTDTRNSSLRGGLLAFEYDGYTIGHCVIYWKDRGKIRIFDPQKRGLWRETNYGKIKAVHSYEMDTDLLKLPPASCLFSRARSL